MYTEVGDGLRAGVTGDGRLATSLGAFTCFLRDPNSLGLGFCLGRGLGCGLGALEGFRRGALDALARLAFESMLIIRKRSLP